MSIRSKRSSFLCVPESLSSLDGGIGRSDSIPLFKTIKAKGSTLLLRGMLRRIIGEGTLTLIAQDGRTHFVCNGAPSVIIRITGPGVILRLPRARANVVRNYDLSDTLYDLFLGADRQYSRAYFVSPDDTLERVQKQKTRHLAAKLLSRPRQRILDIGAGWGGLALYLARAADVQVTGVTLSAEQHAYSKRRADETSLANNVRFLLKDYRQERDRHDRIVSVGMFEHVGVGHYREYFETIGTLLQEDGVALLHTIGRADGPGAANAWISKYIFAGGYIPALSEILPAVERAGLHVTDIEVLRLHYAETLKAWRQRVNANRERISAVYDERFCRMWEFYLAGCEAGFRRGGLPNFQIQLSRRIGAVPLTRDYIDEWESSHEHVPIDTVPVTDLVRPGELRTVNS